ncbi:MAG TPA: glutamine amidotransferase, partial [Polyangiaceae bacterium]
GLECTEAHVTVRELLRGEEPIELAKGTAKFEKGTATVQLSVTLERAGPCVVEVSMQAPPGDTIPENDTRVLTFNVTRDRIRLLHVAGHPSYDARALRRWLKSDESLDLVAFFILRTEGDDPQASDSDLALIPFPVDDLFQGEPLRSFDAVVLQDIDSVEYKFAKYLDPLARYVRAGGGLVMVGGASSFTAGGYAGTKLEQVLPVHLDQRERPFDGVEFVPRYTESGRQAPVLHALRALVGDQLPSMAGSNTLGPAREGALVLWEHPERRAGGEPMPVLALGEAGDGRAIALGVDGTHLLAFSQMAAAVAGRGYGALWDGLLRWLMRDPRVEAARMELVGECIAGEPATLRLVRTAGATGSVRLRLEQLGVETTKPLEFAPKADATGSIEVDLGRLKPGGYTVSARIGAAPPTRYDFACERGGQAWSDSRPDPARLERISKATGGRAVSVESVGDLPLPAATEVTAERHVSPLLPPWAWTLMAALALGGHWFVRRRGGLA